MNDAELLDIFERAKALIGGKPEVREIEYRDSIAPAIKRAPTFSDKSLFFSGIQIQLGPAFHHHAFWWLLEQRGATGVLNWFKKLSQTTIADVVHFTEVIGLSCSAEHKFDDTLSIRPWAELQSDFAKSVYEHYNPGTFFTWGQRASPLVAITQLERGVKGRNDFNKSTRPDRDEELITAISAIPNASPSMGFAWSEFVDPDLELARFGMAWRPPRSEAPPDNSGRQDVIPFVDKVAKVLALGGGLRSALDIGLNRVNVARRRLSNADAAIDCCICLEAIYGSDTSEMTHKISVRASLTLGRSVQEREEIFHLVKALYSFRSKVVHGRAPSLNLVEQRSLIMRGLEICRRAIDYVIQTGAHPNTEKVELAPPSI